MLEERSEQLYRDIPESQRERLRDFWWAHPCRTQVVGDTTWRYLEGGKGQRLVLLIPGGYLPAQFWFGVIEELEPEVHIIATDAPACLGLLDPRRVAESLASLIDALGAYGAAVVAHGEAGLAAQCLLEAYPHRVQALALVNSPLLDPRTGADAMSRVTGWLAERLPWAWFGAKVSGTLVHSLPCTTWAPYVRALFSAPNALPSREQALALQRASLAACSGAQHNPRTLEGWRGHCAVIVASDDWRTARDATALAARYRRARVHWFADGGPALPALYPEELGRVLRAFLAEAWAVPETGLAAPYLQGQDGD